MNHPLRTLLNLIRGLRNRSIRAGLRLLGWRLLRKKESDEFLRPYLVDQRPNDAVPLPDVPNKADPTQLVFHAKEAHSWPTHVWHVPTNGLTTTVLPSGVVKRENTVLCTDYWNHHIARAYFRNRRRTPVDVETIVVPFSHESDGMTFGGYYDFIYLIFAKLCRIERTLPGGFANVAVTYPLFHTAYEAELLALLGFTPDRIFDSRQYEVRSERCLLGNGGDWFYPNLADLTAAYERLTPLLSSSPQSVSSDRIYISRSGRRRITNEEALMNVLSQYGFAFIEDRPRPIGEQLHLYHQASFIIGPHGASFSNMNWCKPGTYLHEICSVNYAPDYFLYLAQVRQMPYSVSLHNIARRQPLRRSLVEDITVSIPDVERVINDLLTAQLAGLSSC